MGFSSAMQILHATTFLQGGAGKIILDLALHQHNSGHKVSILMNQDSEPGYCNYPDYLTILEQTGVRTFAVDSTFKRDVYRNINAAKELRSILEDNQINIIHAHAATPALIGIIGRSGLKRYIP